MAQNALTVTNPNPTPPTNFVNVGATAPDPATYDPTVYGTDWRYPPQNQYPGGPQYDDGTAGALTAFATKHAALPVGGTSVDHEGLGTEIVYTAPGSVSTYPTQSVGVGPVETAATIAAGPNAKHASYLSGGTAPVISSLSAGGAAGTGYAALTVTGTGFNRSSVVYVDGRPQTTNFVSATSLTVTNAPKKPTSGNLPVIVTNASYNSSNSFNWAFT